MMTIYSEDHQHHHCRCRSYFWNNAIRYPMRNPMDTDDYDDDDDDGYDSNCDDDDDGDPYFL